MRRLGIAFFYDRDGVVDDYYLHLLDAMRPHLARLVVVVNGALDGRSEDALGGRADTLVLRENEGFDVWAYKAGLEQVGYPALGDYDEVLLFNHTFFGPIYPFAEMFDAMAGRSCAFWGITAHAAVPSDPGTNGESIPFHLNSHFIAVRHPLATHPSFRAYWDGMAPIPSYESSIRLHELVFTPHFRALGFAVDTYVDPDLYGSDYSAFFELDETLLRSRSPILKRRAFFHDPAFCQARAIDLPRALAVVEQTSAYPVELIWQNIVRATNARTLHANAALMTVLPDEPAGPAPAAAPPPRIALCVHAHYDDLVPEILDRAAAIPGGYDLIATTDTEGKRVRIERMAAGRSEIGRAIVRVTQARGRDMGALLISCHDLLTSGSYDLVCRVHTKKAPQVDPSLGALFKRRTLGATLPGEKGIATILRLFASNARLGLVMPPMFHIGYPTFGHSWFVNRRRAEAVAAMLGIAVPFDDFSPVAAYGGMFWFRPPALKRLFAGWKWQDFEPEPAPVDGALAHALERLVVYAAMAEGYGFRTAAPASHVAHDYAALEFKHNLLTGLLPSGDPAGQADLLGRNRGALWDAHVAGRPLLGPAEADRLREEAERQARGARAAVEAAEAVLASKTAALQRAIDRAAALVLAEGDGSTPSAMRDEAARLASFLAGLPQAGQAAPGPDRVLRYAVSHDEEVGRALCPLFDPVWYRRQHPDDDGSSPLDHYIRVGMVRGAWPHPLLDPAEARGGEPIAGCLAAATPSPHRLLDPAHLATRLPEAPGVPLPCRYLTEAGAADADPHPLFDTAHYRAAGPSLPAGTLPLAHFVATGWRQNRDPHPLFDVAHYLHQVGHDLAPTDDPLSHYLRDGWAAGLDPHPLFDTRYYLAVNGDVREARFNPLVHYVLYGAREGRNPHGCFATEFYRRRHMNGDGGDPLADFLRHGRDGSRDPSPAFDAAAYLSDHRDVAAVGMNPLVHYVVWGRGEHRRIRPLPA